MIRTNNNVLGIDIGTGLIKMAQVALGKPGTCKIGTHIILYLNSLSNNRRKLIGNLLRLSEAVTGKRF